MGKPFGKQRPRATHKMMQLYTPRETHQYEQQVRKIATRKVQMLAGPLQLDIKAYFPIPKSYSKKRRVACLAGTEFPTKTPDKDNIEKIIMDGLNPVYKTNKATHKKELRVAGMYLDDKQVVAGKTTKLYGEPARVEVLVTELEKE